MLCKLLCCHSKATTRCVTPFGTANLCDGHAAISDGWLSTNGTSDLERHTLDGLAAAFRYGPREDPPLEQDERGADYAHPRNGSE